MKQLELTPPLLIITMGYPGSGKTFFARQFTEQYQLPRVSEERIRFELFEQPAFSSEEAEIIGRIGLYMLEELMKSGQTIVYDGLCARHKDRKALYELAQKQGYRSLAVWVQTDIDTAAQRAIKRDRRNPDNKYAFDLDSTTFDSLRGQLQRPQEKEVAVVVSGKHAYKSQCLTVLRKITTVYGEELAKRQTTPVLPRASTRPIHDMRRIIQ